MLVVYFFIGFNGALLHILPPPVDQLNNVKPLAGNVNCITSACECMFSCVRGINKTEAHSLKNSSIVLLEVENSIGYL